ncbi:5'-3' exoribonuclease 3-like [Dorcoceras hygrometricum]|uniref:5'-3' exoribonuclease n=1 Tax=Dorcoceras hygrometricum TaxID=472368 RepID=A0A2Z7AEJ6_9LAMI|nr:5'-3' exoribonuclease 3-like [Dorcoceras hygrometricum]
MCTVLEVDKSHKAYSLFPPTTLDEVFCNIYDYIDRLFNIVRPRKLLYLAIDGVAPRAKMNQQRSRRFRAAKDLQVAVEVEDKLRREFEMEGKVLLPKEESQVSDSNVITPGTEFMYTLASKLRSYIRQRLSDSVAWRNIKVILSDASVPGEGEHKIMSYIRAQRSSPGYDPNTRHCLYGLDADLIMLALATHEIHFSIIREDVRSAAESGVPEAAEACILKSRVLYKRDPFQQTSFRDSHQLESQKEPINAIDKSLKKKPYQFLHVWILREYLALDLEITSLPEKLSYDFERIIDDFILMCCFAGNDFLPHMPSLEIHEGAIDLLMHVYKTEFKNLGGYLVDMQKAGERHSRYMKLKRVERFLITVGEKEEKIFEKRAQIRDRKLRRILLDMTDANDHETNSFRRDGRASDFEGYIDVNQIEQNIVFNKDHDKKCQKEDESASIIKVSNDQILENTKDLKQMMKDYMRRQSDLFKDGCFGTDKVKFGTAGWKDRYYKEKFGVESPEEVEALRRNVITKYGEGLCWVLLYYFSGVPSWTWYYPYQYGPLASDFRGLTQIRVKFEKGSPFKPFDQLMGVLPPKSAHALPEAYQRLMIDEDSSIIDLYPTEFETDVDGKRYLWQGVVKLPFIDERRLLIESKKLEDELKEHEKRRNLLQSQDLLFLTSSDKLETKIISCGRNRDSVTTSINIDIAEMGIDGTVLSVSADEDDGADFSKDVMCVFYESFQGLQHLPRLLEGVDIPEKTVDKSDVLETKLWHEARGRNASNFNRFQNQSRSGKRECNLESRPRISYVHNAPNAILKGTGSGFKGRGTKSMTTQECNQVSRPRATNVRSNVPNAMIKEAGWGSTGRGQTPMINLPAELAPTQHATRISTISRSNTWGSRTRDHRSSVANCATYNYNGKSKLGFGGDEGWQVLDVSSSTTRPQQSITPWESRQGGYGQGSSSQIWKYNLSSSTYDTNYGHGKREQAPGP